MSLCSAIWPFIGQLTVRYCVQMIFGDPVSDSPKMVEKNYFTEDGEVPTLQQRSAHRPDEG
jgi:hypothetical protein